MFVHCWIIFVCSFLNEYFKGFIQKETALKWFFAALCGYVNLFLKKKNCRELICRCLNS